jgi:hypothetical protein
MAVLVADADIAARILAIRASLVGIDAQLDSGATKMADGERSISWDLEALRKRKAELVTELSELLRAGQPSIRRVLTYSTKGL